MYDYWKVDLMIGVLRGVLHSSGAVMLPSGIGYSIRHCGASRPAPGDEVEFLITSTVTRDGEVTLWAFDTPDERLVFGALTNIPRVGPSVAGAILRGVGAGGVVAAAQAGDATPIKAVKGVGAKTADSIIQNFTPPEGVQAQAGPAPVEAGLLSDVVHTLAGMGFPRDSVESAIEHVPEEQRGTVQDLVAAALPILTAKGAA